MKKERLLAISDLKLTGKIERMDEQQLNEYAQALTSFVKEFPVNEKRLKIALEASDFDFYAKYLATMGEMLSKIYADDMAAECQKQINSLKNAKYEKIEAFTTYFLKSVSMLSIDIQSLFKETIDKKPLLEIADLNSGKIDKLDDKQLNEFLQALNSFIEKFPEKENELKAALEAKDYEVFTKCLKVVEKMLASIYADDMAAECQKQIAEIKNTKHEKIEAFVTYFLKSVSMLSIDLQMVKYKKSDEKGGASNCNPEESSNGKKSILAIDDTDFFLRTLKSLLQDTQYKLTCTTSGKAALNFLEKNKPDLFILDIEMPEMNGYELAQKIRECGQQAPIIFLTGNSTRECVEKALKAGAAGFIVKPISKTQILERITKFI